MNQHSVVCFDLTVVREAMGCDVYGFIGMDFLKDCIITIDFAAGRVDFLPPGTARQPAWGESVPFEYDNMQRPRIHAVVGNDLETSFVVDTGHASTGSLDEAALTFLVDLQKVRITGNSRYMAASGSFSSATMRVSRLTIGPFQHDDLRFSSGKEDVIGLGYLARYRATIDFPARRIYLAKGKKYAQRDRGNTTGLHILFKASGIEFESVDESGPAYAAGARAKDLLVEFCGKPASAWKPLEIFRLLEEEGRPLKMAVQRGGKKTEIRFTPREYEGQPGEAVMPGTADCSGIPAIRPGLRRPLIRLIGLPAQRR